MADKQIALYGATGFTGRLIAGRLAAEGLEFRIGGRDSEKLEELADELGAQGRRPEVVVADVDEPQRLEELMDGAAVVINCAGPFCELARPVVDAALRSKTHYLDTTGEQEFIRWVSEKRHDDAETRKVALMPSCAFEFALGDLAAEIALEKAAHRIVVAYAVRDFKMSHGTKKSLVRTLAEGGLGYRDGRHRQESTGCRLFDVPFPDGKTQKGVWVPGGEAITVPRRGGVSRVETCVVATGSMAHLAAAIVGKIPALMRLLQPVTDRIVEQTSGDPHQAQEKPAKFRVVAFDPRNSEPFVTLEGVDPYEVTAAIVVEAATRIVNDGPLRTGFVGPADLFEPRQFLSAVDVEVSE